MGKWAVLYKVCSLCFETGSVCRVPGSWLSVNLWERHYVQSNKNFLSCHGNLLATSLALFLSYFSTPLGQEGTLRLPVTPRGTVGLSEHIWSLLNMPDTVRLWFQPRWSSCIPPSPSLSQLKDCGHNTTEKHKKALKGRKKKADFPGSSGLEEHHSGGTPGFLYCLQYIPDRVLHKPPTWTCPQAHPDRKYLQEKPVPHSPKTEKGVT